MQHWTITRDADGLAWLTFDKAATAINTLSAAVLAELNEALDVLDRDPPKGLVIRSGKANGFVAGADVDEFGHVQDDAGAIAIVRRGWDTFERLSACRVPDPGARSRFLPGRRARAGARMPLPRRRRRARDAARTARSDARHRPGMGRHQAAAAAGRRAGRARPAAHRQDHRRAPREEAGHRRRMRAGADHGQHRARRVARIAATALAALPAVADAESARAPAHCGAGCQAGREARAPRTLSGAVRGARSLGQVRRRRAQGTRDGSGFDSLAVPLADDRQPDPRVQACRSA